MFERPVELEQKFPQVFSVCTVTRAMAAKQWQALPDDKEMVDIADSFMGDCDSWASPAASVPPPAVAPAPPIINPHVEDWDSSTCMSQEQLIVEQRRD